MKVLEANESSYTRLINFLEYVNAHKDISYRHFVNADDIANYMSSNELDDFVSYLMHEFGIEESDIDD